MSRKVDIQLSGSNVQAHPVCSLPGIALNRHIPLRFIATDVPGEELYISRMPRVHCVPQGRGVKLMDGNVLAGALLPVGVAAVSMGVFMSIEKRMAAVYNNVRRTSSTANFSVGFYVAGFKQDSYNTRYMIKHSLAANLTVEQQVESCQLWGELRDSYLRYVQPKVLQYLGHLFLPVLNWLELKGLQMCVTSLA